MTSYSKLATKNGFLFTLEDAWIPVSLSQNLIVEKSFNIFNFRFEVGSYKTFLYNPNTKQLLIDEKAKHLDIHQEHAVKKEENKYDDFVKGYITDKSNNVIRLEGNVGKMLLNEKQSHKLMKTLEMFMLNGANENTKLRYITGKTCLFEDAEYRLKYFMKTKNIW